MNIELAAQLHNVAFPKKEYLIGDIFYAKNADTNEWVIAVITEKELNDPYFLDFSIVFIPSLPELIEACGDCGFALHQVWNGWRAYSGYADDDYKEDGKGSTPEEAVANLWLALNKK